MKQPHDVTIDPIEQEVVFDDDGKGNVNIGQTHDVTIDPIEQEVVFDDDGKGNRIMRLIMKALKEKDNG